jgi:aspartokinase/homoserine dehydrogenase 1
LSGLLVMKFGGTSMGSAERIRVAAELIQEQARVRPVVVVVSAMSKVTDLLLDAMKHAEARDSIGLAEAVGKLRAKHLEAVDGLGLGPEAVQATVDLVGEFQRLVGGMLMLGERPARSVDEAVAIGERLSALLLARFLGDGAIAVNSAELIVTDSVFGNASPFLDQTAVKAKAVLLPMLAAGKIPVATGFNGATVDGRGTTLGRGGSDFSASILSAALDAEELWIWTDVDGIMTADPRLVPDARVLEEVSFSEAAELAYNGAKVLHPRTLSPLVEKRIPVWSKNSFAPGKPGTRIVPELSVSSGARAVTSMRDVALISVEPAHAALSGAHVLARTMDALARANVEVLTISASSYRQSFCFLVRDEELARTVETLEAGLALELTHGYVSPLSIDREVGLLAVVGEGMRGTQGLAGRIFTAISRENVNIMAIAQGSSELTIAIIVRRSGLEKAVRAVHAECHL